MPEAPITSSYPKDEIGVRVQGRIEHGLVEDFLPLVGLPANLATGRVDVTADIHGTLERGRNPLAGLVGPIFLVAEDGEIRQEVPLIVSLATATDGFNPFASRQSMHYDTIDAEIYLDRGVLRADRFAVEGPIRIFASGTLDFARGSDEIDAVVGVFVLQRVRELLGMVPLVKLIVPGSEKGMVGAYFSVEGSSSDPEIETLAMKSLYNTLPELITKPLDLIHGWLKSEPKNRVPRADQPSGKTPVAAP